MFSSSSSSSSSFVAFVGSRSWVSEGAPVAALAGAVVGAGWGVGVGCCLGADALVLCAAAAAPSVARRCSVFASFGPLGVGACGLSAVGAVAAAAAAGASVSWWSGGGPAVPVRARLASRTRALVSSPACVGVVAFLASGSVGSVAACRLAAGRGLPVVAFVCGSGSQAPPAPLFVGGGSWAPAGGGLWAFGWRWVPASASLFPAPAPPWLWSGGAAGS